MGKHKQQNTQFYSSPEFAPDTLADQPFYGLNLDPEQEQFRDAIYDPKTVAVFCNAKAGTGKSTIALGTANLLVQYGFYDGIIYIMSPTQEQRQGFLPGGTEEKNAPYMQPLVDAMNTLNIPPYCLQSEENIQGMKTGDAYIQFTVDTYLRGCNFERKVIIVDEFQNFYFDDAKKTLTRMHDNNKIIMIGHNGQCDIIKHSERGCYNSYMKAFSKVAESDPRIKICELKTNHRGWFSNFCDDVKYDPS